MTAPGTRTMPAPAPDRVADEPHQLQEGRPLGAHGVDDRVRPARAPAATLKRARSSMWIGRMR